MIGQRVAGVSLIVVAFLFASSLSYGTDPAGDAPRVEEILDQLRPGSILNGHKSARILVRYRPGISRADREFKRGLNAGAKLHKSFQNFRGLEVVEVAESDVSEAIRSFEADPDVLYAEADGELQLFDVPNDPLFGSLWGLKNIGQQVNGTFCHATSTPGADIRIEGAWRIWTGDPEFRIAIVDTGINYLHSDLAGNVWKNPGEAPGDANGDGCPGVCGVDDDGDGLIDEDSNGLQPWEPGYLGDLIADDDENGWNDDIHGYDFINNDPDPMDDNSHGSHVAGTIGAVGHNGLGVTGINWRCRMIGLKLFSASGSGGAISDALEVLDYIITNRIRVSNNSWGTGVRSQALYDAIRETQSVGHLFIAAAGNGFNNNNDANGIFPAAFDLPNIVSVAASDNRDGLARFSNIGWSSVDIAAPGACILSTVLGQNYGYKDGTSMATPHVVGVAALLMSRRPELSADQVKKQLMLTARPVPDWLRRTVTGGILDASAAVGDCNGNGVPDELEVGSRQVPDCDRNGIPDECEPDCNGNGRADSCDLFFKRSVDCNLDGIPDECGADCNGNLGLDVCDVAMGFSPNCNANHVPDECELADYAPDGEPPEIPICGVDCRTDCNGNGVPDDCDIASGFSQDCTRNGIPDECEPDCNGNHRADSCDIGTGFSRDCTNNGVPDECEEDCNQNGVADICEVRFIPDSDCNGNGVIDDCEPGTEADCNQNGVRDLCEMRRDPHDDCNENAVLDFCDIRDGTSADANMNGIPDDCDGRGFAIYPVAVSGEHELEGDVLVLFGGGHRITFEVFVAGWDPEKDGSPLLRGYELRFPTSSYTGGDYGRLSPARVACATSADCVRQSTCLADGFCDLASTAYIDVSRADFVLADLLPLRLVNRASSGEITYISVTWNALDSVADPGIPKYVATLVLDVSPLAAGTFTVRLHRDLSRWVIHGTEVRRVPTRTHARIRILGDCNLNGRVDSEDIAFGSSFDCNGNGIPDECLDVESDCNGNDIPDECDVADGFSLDCDMNGIPDECISAAEDCNGNGIPDACDIAAGAADCNANGVPDACDVRFGTSQDCNANGIPDDCTGFEPDCDNNGRPDECDITDRPEIDCNGNSTPDSCDIVNGTSLDLDGDGIPDECSRILRVPSQFGSLREAVAAARSGDVVLVADGVYSGPDNTGISFQGRTLTVLSENGPASCIIDGGEEAAAFTLGSGDRLARIEGFTIQRCRGADGAGISLTRSSVTIRRCWFIGNRADGLGGGLMANLASHPTVTECIFAGNIAGSGGGAVAADRQSNPLFRSCLFVGNSTPQAGGAVFLENLSLATLEQCTIVENAASTGGGIYTARSRIHAPGFNAPAIRNSILWDNRATGSTGHELAVAFGAQLFVEYSNIRGGLSLSSVDPFAQLRWGDGNISTFPHFRSPSGPDNNPATWRDNNYRLNVSSLLIDAGVPGPLFPPDALDLDGRTRLRCAAVDPGAYEGGFGDTDCDRQTTLIDYHSLSGCMSGPVPQGKRGEADCSVFDFEADGDADLRDLARFQNLFGFMVE